MALACSYRSSVSVHDVYIVEGDDYVEDLDVHEAGHGVATSGIWHAEFPDGQ